MVHLRRLMLLLGALCCAAPAAAQPPPGTVAPPGNSGVKQYVETVPSFKGNRRAGGAGGPQAAVPDGPGALDAGTREGLRELGRDGTAVERLHDVGGRPQPGAPTDEVVRAARDRSGVIGTAVSRGAGSGVLPVLLALVVVVALAMWFGRRRLADRP